MPPDARGAGWLAAGPVLLGLVIGMQASFWAWGLWDQRMPTPNELEVLTTLGKVIYLPDHDRLIYAGGVSLSLALMLLLNAAWGRQITMSRCANEVQSLRLLMWAHFPAAAVLTLLRLLYVPAKPLSLMAAVGGLIFATFSLWLARRRTLVPSARPPAPHRLRHYIGLTAVGGLVVLLVYIPSPGILVGQAYLADHFHHLDFYAMAPALAFQHGIALGSDFFSQYGVGWPMVLALLGSGTTALSYKLLFALCVVYGCIYYVALWGLLRLLLQNFAWAVAGLLFTLLLQLFSGTDGPAMWLWPSSTVMRYSMDVFVFAACLLHARTGKPALGLAAGTFTGLALLLGTDTGVYLTACLGIYVYGYSRLGDEDGRRRQPVGGFALLSSTSGVLVLLGGLAVASRGTFLEWPFWFGWIESLRQYRDGVGHLPVANAINGDWTAYALFAAMMMCYLLAAARLLHAGWHRRLAPESLVVGIVAVYGLAVLLLFIGRSHPYNLHHASVPFCVILSSFCAAAWHRLCSSGLAANVGAKRSIRQAAFATVPFGLAYLTLLAICVHPNFKLYPSLYLTLARDRWRSEQPVQANYLFESRRDGALGKSHLNDINRFRAIAAMIRKVGEGGRHSVAVIDMDDTAYLLEADLPPYFRYSPVIAHLVLSSQLRQLLDQLASRPPDYIVMPVAAPRLLYDVVADDVHRAVLLAIRGSFSFDQEVAGMAVYRRNGRAGVAFQTRPH